MYFLKKCYIVLVIENEISSCVATLLDSLLSESEVVFMSFILYLLITLMVSLTINVALLTIIYIQYVNRILDKE